MFIVIVTIKSYNAKKINFEYLEAGDNNNIKREFKE